MLTLSFISGHHFLNPPSHDELLWLGSVLVIITHPHEEFSMIYDEGFITFKAAQNGAILTLTFDYPPVNVQGRIMLADLDILAQGASCRA